jgi:mannonate dehydratase
MKITNLKVIVTSPGRNYVIVKIETDEGISGIGDATLNGRELSVAKTLEEYLRPL